MSGGICPGGNMSMGSVRIPAEGIIMFSIWPFVRPSVCSFDINLANTIF